MSEVGPAPGALTIRTVVLPADGKDLARLCWAYRDLLIARMPERPEIVEAYYAAEDYGRLIADLPRIHARPRGDILLAEAGGAVLGCAMYYPLGSPGLCEIKRVYVDDAARGLGAGRALMTGAMARAAADGHRRMVLDTMVNLTEAIALYHRLGFAGTDPFYDLDPRFRDDIRFFGRDLV